MPCAAFASKALSLPPNTGHIATAAYSRPGGRTSMAKRALPSVLPATSLRGTGWPTSRYCDAGLSVTLAGGAMSRACAATSPKPACRPPGPISRPSCTLTCAACTFHARAAASTSVARAVAAASRTGCQASATLLLPPVMTSPISRALLAMIQCSARAQALPASSGCSGSALSTTLTTLP